MDKYEVASKYIKNNKIVWESITEEQLYVLAVEFNFADPSVGSTLGATKE